MVKKENGRKRRKRERETKKEGMAYSLIAISSSCGCLVSASTAAM